MSKQVYVIMCNRPWDLALAKRCADVLNSDERRFVAAPSLTQLDYVADAYGHGDPRYVFFPNWSERVPNDVLSRYECVCFHETDLPFGRGGSPIQNMIELGMTKTVVSAIRMTEKIDEGPIYSRSHPVSLDGLVEEIYLRISDVVFRMIEYIVDAEPTPVPQPDYAVTFFKRRTPDQSSIAGFLENAPQASLADLFDHIRMLDAIGYPRAFLKLGDYTIEFSRPALRCGEIHADVTIRKGTP